MKTFTKLIPLFSCLLFICPGAHSDISKEEKFNLLSHYDNTSLVEDSLKLVGSTSKVAVSTVINHGFWYSICKSPELVSAVAGRFGLSGTEEIELQEIKSSFCNQLATVITSAEIALAGQLSLWPHEQPWWQPLRYMGTAYIGYKAYTQQEPYHVPLTTLAFFTNEVVMRTVAGAAAIQTLRNQGTVWPLDYARREYSMLSTLAGLMVGTIVYEQMLAKDVSAVKAAFACIISATLTLKILAISSFSALNSGSFDFVGTGAEAESLAGNAVLAGSFATTMSGMMWVGSSLNQFITLAIVATAFPMWGIAADYKILAGLVTGTAVSTGIIELQKLQRSKLDSRHLLSNLAISLAPALAIALINGVSNNVVYGYPLEETLSETARSQLQKFYAPLDYLYSFFN